MVKKNYQLVKCFCLFIMIFNNFQWSMDKSLIPSKYIEHINNLKEIDTREEMDWNNLDKKNNLISIPSVISEQNQELTKIDIEENQELKEETIIFK